MTTQIAFVGNVPVKAHEDDAGFDLVYDCPAEPYGCVLMPGKTKLFRTGTIVDLPAGTVGLVCPRSGLALNHQITILNSPGIIDAGYRGEICVPLISHSRDPGGHSFVPGDRIAQLVIVRLLEEVEPVSVTALSETERGANGFGSTDERSAAA